MMIGLRWLPCDIMALYLLIILDSCIEPMKTSPSDKILFIPESFKRKRMYSMRSYVYESLFRDNSHMTMPDKTPKSSKT